MRIFPNEGQQISVSSCKLFFFTRAMERRESKVPLHPVLSSVMADWGELHSGQYVAQIIIMDNIMVDKISFLLPRFTN